MPQKTLTRLRNIRRAHEGAMPVDRTRTIRGSFRLRLSVEGGEGISRWEDAVLDTLKIEDACGGPRWEAEVNRLKYRLAEQLRYEFEARRKT